MSNIKINKKGEEEIRLKIQESMNDMYNKIRVLQTKELNVLELNVLVNYYLKKYSLEIMDIVNDSFYFREDF